MPVVCQWFGLKTTGTIFSGLASKSMATTSHRFGPQNRWRWFVSGLTSKSLGRFLIGLGLKTDGDGLSVIWPQNHWDGFLRFGLKTGGDDFSLVWASKPLRRFSLGLLQNLLRWFLPV
jgi:hypothetical protein